MKVTVTRLVSRELVGSEDVEVSLADELWRVIRSLGRSPEGEFPPEWVAPLNPGDPWELRVTGIAS